MRRLNTAQFKREYRSLTEPVLVTSGGKSVGVWTPTISRLPDYEGSIGHLSDHQVPARSLGAVLAHHEAARPAEERDAYHPSGWLRWRSFAYPEDPNAR